MTISSYRYPEECCGKCKHSYQSSYGDYQCGLIPGSIIDIGGVCDHYDLESAAPALIEKAPERVPTVPLPIDNNIIKQCFNCQFSTEVNGQAICLNKGTSIKPEDTCRSWKGANNDEVYAGNIVSNDSDISSDVAIDDFGDLTSTSINAGSCSNCVHSYFDTVDNLPHCNVDGSIIHNTNDVCNAFEEEQIAMEQNTDGSAQTEVFETEEATDEAVEEEAEYPCDCIHCKHSYFNISGVPFCGIDDEMILNIEGGCEEAEEA